MSAAGSDKMEFVAKIETEKLDLYYGDFAALKNINMKIPERQITSIIGPSGCGKSTLLRCFNRMNDLSEHVRVEGRIIIEGQNILDADTDLILLRRKVGMVFQRPNVFDLSVYHNLIFGLRIHRLLKGKDEIMGAIRAGLESVGLWEDLRGSIRKNAHQLSLEQQQRLCIARVLLLKPDIILLDESCSALDPIATLRIEELLRELKEQYTVVIVTHNMQQAARVSDYTGFLYMGELIEFGDTDQVFTNPKEELTENYVSGRFG